MRPFACSGPSRSRFLAGLGSPLFLVKARIQAYSPAFPVGAQHYYRNSLDALRTITKSDGVRGLWRGVNAAFLRTAMVRPCSWPDTCRSGEANFDRAHLSNCLHTTTQKDCLPTRVGRPTALEHSWQQVLFRVSLLYVRQFLTRTSADDRTVCGNAVSRSLLIDNLWY